MRGVCAAALQVCVALVRCIIPRVKSARAYATQSGEAQRQPERWQRGEPRRSRTRRLASRAGVVLGRTSVRQDSACSDTLGGAQSLPSCALRVRERAHSRLRHPAPTQRGRTRILVIARRVFWAGRFLVLCLIFSLLNDAPAMHYSVSVASTAGGNIQWSRRIPSVLGR